MHLICPRARVGTGGWWSYHRVHAIDPPPAGRRADNGAFMFRRGTSFLASVLALHADSVQTT